MKTLYAIFFAAIFPFALSAQFNSENLSISPKMDGQAVAAPVNMKPASTEYEKLKLFPVYASTEFVEEYRDLGKFTTLKDAQDKKLVQITEHVDTTRNAGQQQIVNNNVNQGNQQQVVNGYMPRTSETVNTLFIENTSNDTVYIMAGEVVKGGKQDRVIAQDMILAPKSGKIDISVFCVEHGRWTYKGEGGKAEFKSAGYAANMSVRKEVDVNQSQSGVWTQVSNTNMANNTATNSDAYTANETNDKFQKELTPYLENFESLPYSDSRMVGVVAVSGDKVIGCDIFATHDLFVSQYKVVLNGYASEAITNGAKVTADEKKVQDYLDKILNEENQEKNLEGKGKIQKVKIGNGPEKAIRMSSY